MGRPTNEEIARRKAESEKQPDQNIDIAQPTTEVAEVAEVVTEAPAVDDGKVSAGQEPAAPAPAPAAVKTAVIIAKPDEGVFDVSPEDLKHFQANKLAEEKKKSLDAIEQAVTDACKIATDKVRRDPVVVALANDPGDVGKRLSFLGKFGPTSMKPPKPAPTPYGLKDPDLMEWSAKYEPDNFIATYGNGTSPLTLRLLASIRANA